MDTPVKQLLPTPPERGNGGGQRDLHVIRRRPVWDRSDRKKKVCRTGAHDHNVEFPIRAASWLAGPWILIEGPPRGVVCACRLGDVGRRRRKCNVCTCGDIATWCRRGREAHAHPPSSFVDVSRACVLAAVRLACVRLAQGSRCRARMPAAAVMRARGAAVAAAAAAAAAAASLLLLFSVYAGRQTRALSPGRWQNGRQAGERLARRRGKGGLGVFQVFPVCGVGPDVEGLRRRAAGGEIGFLPGRERKRGRERPRSVGRQAGRAAKREDSAGAVKTGCCQAEAEAD